METPEPPVYPPGVIVPEEGEEFWEESSVPPVEPPVDVPEVGSEEESEVPPDAPRVVDNVE
jgi:hypothetical protein